MLGIYYLNNVRKHAQDRHGEIINVLLLFISFICSGRIFGESLGCKLLPFTVTVVSTVSSSQSGVELIGDSWSETFNHIHNSALCYQKYNKSLQMSVKPNQRPF